MNLRDELHSLIDGLDASDSKRRLHVFVNEMDDETVHTIIAQVEKLRQRRLEQWGFRM